MNNWENNGETFHTFSDTHNGLFINFVNATRGYDLITIEN